MGLYIRPTALADALDALKSGPLQILSGGTDFYPARVGKPLDDDILDISAIDGLRGIEDRGDHWFIGALTTWTDVVRADLPPCFDGLKLAAREVGGVQIQNAGTICGNICNASPAADGMPCLLALEASVQLGSAGGTRTLRLDDFVLGNRKTARRPDELVTGLAVPKLPAGAIATFVKLGARKYLVISIAMVSAVLVPDEAGAVGEARLVVGSCSAVARRLPVLEALLHGLPSAEGMADLVTPAHVEDLHPIDDVRGSADYRREAAFVLVRRALEALGPQWGRR